MLINNLLLLCTLALAGPPSTPGGPAAQVASLGPVHSTSLRHAARRTHLSQTHRHPGIDQVASRVWVIERSLVESYVRDLAALEDLARARRHRSAGGPIDGYYIDRIGRSNPLYAAGLRNGDVIHSVNGDPVRNSLQAFLAFRKHRRAGALHVELTRRDGRELTLTYLVS